MDENVRVLKPGGTIEIWETDHQVRLLRPHVPSASVSGTHTEEQEAASDLGVYIINLNTPLSAPLNPFLIQYNNWIGRALETRELMANPCAVINHYMIQETNTLTGVGSHRVAIPLSEMPWEGGHVGAMVTDEERTFTPMDPQTVEKKSILTAGQATLRRTALLTLLQGIQALESILREASGKSQDEWDVWLGKMRTDLLAEDGSSWGECLEVGAWWAMKK
jgi:hypothetical protein